MKKFSKPIVLYRDEGGVYIPKIGFVFVLPSEVDEIIDGLIKYKNSCSDSEIEEDNKFYIQAELENWKRLESEKTVNERTVKGYVYLLSCADKYKVGYSSNVERRMKQLDTRPFPLELVCKTYSDIAYDVEQRIHKIMSEYKVEGEWYEFDFEIKADEFSDFVLMVEKKILSERG